MRFSKKRRELFLTAIRGAMEARRAGRLDDAFRLLERAHVIGQHGIGPHLLAHWEMLRVGWLRRDLREVAGQILRLALVVPGTAVGRLPEGNTGGADVSAFRPMQIDDALREELAEGDGAP